MPDHLNTMNTTTERMLDELTAIIALNGNLVASELNGPLVPCHYVGILSYVGGPDKIVTIGKDTVIPTGLKVLRWQRGQLAPILSGYEFVPIISIDNGDIDAAVSEFNRVMNVGRHGEENGAYKLHSVRAIPELEVPQEVEAPPPDRLKHVVAFTCLKKDLQFIERRNVLACKQNLDNHEEADVFISVTASDILKMPFRTHYHLNGKMQTEDSGMKVYATFDLAEFLDENRYTEFVNSYGGIQGNLLFGT